MQIFSCATHFKISVDLTSWRAAKGSFYTRWDLTSLFPRSSSTPTATSTPYPTSLGHALWDPEPESGREGAQKKQVANHDKLGYDILPDCANSEEVLNVETDYTEKMDEDVQEQQLVDEDDAHWGAKGIWTFI